MAGGGRRERREGVVDPPDSNKSLSKKNGVCMHQQTTSAFWKKNKLWGMKGALGRLAR